MWVFFRDKILKAFEDPNHEGNSEKYHTGKICLGGDCCNIAGTKWSQFWCFECNAKRMNRLNKSFEKILKDFKKE